MPLFSQAIVKKGKYLNVAPAELTLYGVPPKQGAAYAKESDRIAYYQESKKMLMALQSGAYPKGSSLTVHLHEDPLIQCYTLPSTSGPYGSRYLSQLIPLFNALQIGKCPANFTLKLVGAKQHLYMDELHALVNALKSPKCPSGLTLDLGVACGYSDIVALTSVLKNGKSPKQLHIKYERQPPAQFDFKEEYDEFDRVLRNPEMASIGEEIIVALNHEMADFAQRKKSLATVMPDLEGRCIVQSVFSEQEQNRYQVLENLKKRVVAITQSALRQFDPMGKPDAWKEPYVAQLKDAIKKSLSNPKLDKYSSTKKFLRRLLNVVSFVFAPVKKVVTGTYFYSASGKSKDAVEKVLKICHSIKCRS